MARKSGGESLCTAKGVCLFLGEGEVVVDEVEENVLDGAVLFNWQLIHTKYNYGTYTGVSFSDSIVTSMT